ncbi:MAG TPA: hypothetical protein PLH48_12890, partial [Acinetobacter johnsonii]|nr:hypothetical protein [Acinetobacter johnsonii]
HRNGENESQLQAGFWLRFALGKLQARPQVATPLLVNIFFDDATRSYAHSFLIHLPLRLLGLRCLTCLLSRYAKQ